MAIYTIRRWVDLDAPIVPEGLRGDLFATEDSAHKFIISATRGGEVVTLDGQVVATFIRADGGTVELAGGLESGAAAVTLEAACYAVPGRFALTMYNAGEDGSKTAVYACVGNVINSTTDTIIDPGTVVPDVSDIVAEYAAMQAAVAAANAASAFVPYTVAFANNGQYTINTADLESGYWAYSTKSANTKRLRTKNLLVVRRGMMITYANPTMRIYFGVLETPTSNSYVQSTYWIDAGGSGTVTINQDGYLTFMVDSTSDITVSDYDSTATIITADDQEATGVFRQLINYGTVSVIEPYVKRTNNTLNNVRFVWGTDGSCTVSTNGSASANTVCNLLNPAIPLPYGVAAGDRVTATFKRSAAGVALALYFMTSASDDNPVFELVARDTIVTIPADTTHLRVALFVTSGTTLSTPVTVSNIGILAILTGKQTGGYSVPKVFSDNAATGVLSQINAVGEWKNNAYIDSETGEVLPITGSAVSSVSANMINIPASMDVHIHGATRIALYNVDGETISVETSPGTDYTVSSSTAAMFKVQFGSIDQSALNFYVAYWFTSSAHMVGVEDKAANAFAAANADGTGSAVTGNPIVIENGAKSSFAAITTSGVSSGENVVICHRNIFTIRHTIGTMEHSGTTYTFAGTSIRIRSSGATATNMSSFSSFGSDFAFVDSSGSTSHTYYCNFKFKFAADTWVTATEGANQHIPFDFPVQMRIHYGTGFYPVGTGGTTFLASAGVEYAVFFMVQSGFSGDVTYRPQIEIGQHATAYEAYAGVKMPLLTTGDENLFECGGTLPGRQTLSSETVGIMAMYDHELNQIHLSADNQGTTNQIIRDTTKDSETINGSAYYHIAKFVPGETPVYVRGIDRQYQGQVYAQVSDGTNSWFDGGGGCFFIAEANKEYAYRLVVMPGAKFSTTITPVIATGKYAFELYGTYNGTTVIYTDGNASFTVTPKNATTKEKSVSAQTLQNAVETLTGQHIYTPFSRIKARGPMVSFIDDDTYWVDAVTRYHNVFSSRNALGGYAVITENMRTDPGTLQPADPNLLPLLLEYEQEGFSMLYHCHDQNGDDTRYWIKGNPSYDEDRIRENFMTGLRDMATFGFSNYKYWVTPYGVNEKFIVDLAKENGMQCIMNCPNAYSQVGFVTPYGNVNRWDIPRVIYGKFGGVLNTAAVNRHIDRAAACGAWIIVVSHANGWGRGYTPNEFDDGLGAIVEHCQTLGVEIVPFQVAFEDYRAVFMLNELF